MTTFRAKQVETTDYHDIEKLSQLATETGTAMVWEKVGRYTSAEIDSEILSIEDNIFNMSKRKREITEFKNLILAKSVTK